MSGKPLRDAQGRFTGYRGIGRDRTARRRIEKALEDANRALIEAETRGRHQAEQALRESEQFLRESLDALPSNVAILDQRGTIIAVNTPWKTLVARGGQHFPDGGIGLGFREVYEAAAGAGLDGPKAAGDKIKEVLSGNRAALNYEFPCHTLTMRRWAVISVTTFRTGNVKHAVLVHEDVTERKQLEERDRRLRAELAHVSRLTTAGEMASGLAHELNQPLTAIAHNCDAVLSSVSDQLEPDIELIETVDDIYEQAQRAGGIIRSMRQMTRKDTVAAVPTDINDLVEETVRLTHPEAREKGIEVKLHLGVDLPAPVIDPVQIQQVLVNLERNSVEAMGQKSTGPRKLSIATTLDSAAFIRGHDQ